MNLTKIFDALIEFHQSDSGERNLFKNVRYFYKSPLTLTYQKVEKEKFYGRNIGFNVRPSIRHIVKAQVILSSSLYNSFFSEKNTFLRVLDFIYSFGKYSYNHDKRAKKTVICSEKSTIEFTKVCLYF